MHLRRLIAVGLTGALVAGAPIAAGAASRKKSARAAVSYIASKQKPGGAIPAFSKIGSTSDAVLALAAARRGRRALNRALDYLAKQVRNPASAEERVDTVGEKAKVVLAAVAGRRNPRRFGTRNLAAEINDAQLKSGRYGRGTAVLDHALGMLALRAARAGDRITAARRAARWLKDAQCRDGGWQYDKPVGPQDDLHCSTGGEDDFFTTDTNTSSYAYQALRYRRKRLNHNALRFFTRARDRVRHGWGYSPDSPTDSNSTALVLQAYASNNQATPNGSLRALRRLQYRLCGKRGGAFAFTWESKSSGGYRRSGRDLGATIGAVPGLLGRPLPLRPATVTKGVPQRKAC